MRPGLGGIDWSILVVYLLGMLVLGGWLATRQRNPEDYFLGGKRLGWVPIGLSLVANQVSAISLIGAPAFIALKEGGGLAWLQYELAVPLAMIAIIGVLVPVYHRTGGLTIFQFLESRFGRGTRSAMSLVFLVSRALGASVALLATALVAGVVLDLPLVPVLVGVGVIAMTYTALGGMSADVVSDVIQLGVLFAGAVVAIAVLLFKTASPLAQLGDPARLGVFRLEATGLGDGQTFAFLPMLVGGLFLYFSYYGCDQTQAQRLLALRNPGEAAKALALNAAVRFPLVLVYCAMGLLLIPFLAQDPGLSASMAGRPPDALVPTFFVTHVPQGLLGVVVAGILAATMSSLDSAVNALSASTWNDLLLPVAPRLSTLQPRTQVRVNRMASLAWGALVILGAWWIAGGHDTVIERVNKIGSAFFGPVAGVFLLGILFDSVRARGALAGLAAGLGVNLALWIGCPGVSWMWWNVSGCLACLVTGWAFGGGGGLSLRASRPPKKDSLGVMTFLGVWFLVILLTCLALESALTRVP